MAFRRPSGSSAARGYGYAHRQERQRRLPVYPQCTCLGYCREHTGPCGRALTRSAVLPHLPDRSGYYDGLWCRRCNQREAARRGAAVVNARKAPSPYRW